MNTQEFDHLKRAAFLEKPLVIFRSPGKDHAMVISQSEKQIQTSHYDDIEKLKGFIVAPFRGKKINHFYCIKPDTCLNASLNDQFFFEMLNGLTLPEDVDISAYEMTKQEYIDRAEYLVEVLKDGGLRKVVLSRIVGYNLPDDFRIGNYLHNLMVKYPKAFVYLVSLPGHGTWIGATPEVLYKIETDHAETIALAGTQPADSFDWTEKEIKEQQIVMDYIEELLHSYGIHEYGKTGPYTVKAGNIVHLKTRYNLSLEQMQGNVGKLLAGLHPTPAVCGLPRNKAYELIRKVEKHQRRFYTGFLGPWDVEGQSCLYVNLRCAEIYKNKMSLFVGGGLTAESFAESEWEETVRKSETLLSVVEKS